MRILYDKLTMTARGIAADDDDVMITEVSLNEMIFGFSESCNLSSIAASERDATTHLALIRFKCYQLPSKYHLDTQK